MRLTAPIAGAIGWMLNHRGDECPSNRSKGGVPRTVLLPVTELVRALFGSSSEMLKQVFDGRRDPSILPSRFKIDLVRSCIDHLGVAMIYADRALDRADALVIALMLADGTGRLRRFHDSIHQALNVDPAFKTQEGAYLQADWPWEHSMEMEFEGRWIRRVPPGEAVRDEAIPVASRFVITRIVRMFPTALPKEVEVHHPRGIEHDPLMPPRMGRSVASGPAGGAIRSDRSPGNDRSLVVFDVPGAEFPGLEAIPMRYVPTTVSSGRNDGAVRSGHAEGEQFLATDDPVPGGDENTGPATFQRTEESQGADQTREGDEARRKTWKALEDLARGRNWRVTYWTEAEKGVGMVPFSPERHHELPPTVAIVATGSRLKAVADMGSGTGAPASLGVVTDWDGSSKQALARSVFDAADRVGWKWLSRSIRDSPNGIRVEGHRRAPKCWNDPDHYSAVLGKWLD